MIPVVFINCHQYPFIDRIIDGSKKYETRTQIEKNSVYDWTDKNAVKYLYELENIQRVPKFIPGEGKRHGRVWMEYNGREE